MENVRSFIATLFLSWFTSMSLFLLAGRRLALYIKFSQATARPPSQITVFFFFSSYFSWRTEEITNDGRLTLFIRPPIHPPTYEASRMRMAWHGIAIMTWSLAYYINKVLIYYLRMHNKFILLSLSASLAGPVLLHDASKWCGRVRMWGCVRRGPEDIVRTFVIITITETSRKWM